MQQQAAAQPGRRSREGRLFKSCRQTDRQTLRALRGSTRWSFSSTLRQRTSCSARCAPRSSSSRDSRLQKKARTRNTPSATTTREATSIPERRPVCPCLTTRCTSAKPRVSVCRQQQCFRVQLLQLQRAHPAARTKVSAAGDRVFLVSTSGDCQLN